MVRNRTGWLLVSLSLLGLVAATVSAGTGYLYRVRAYNAHGNSEYTNTVGEHCHAAGGDLVLTGLTVSDFVSCYSWGNLSVSQAVTVAPTGVLLLDALLAVGFEGGFSIEDGGEVRVLP